MKPGDKRRISLLNSDFKVVTGIEARRFGKTATHSLSPVQLVAGADRRIHHGVNMARDAIQAVRRGRAGCGLLDLDFLAGFDWLVMIWVYMVLLKKGVQVEVVDRLRRLYDGCSSTVVVNNVLGATIPNTRGSLRQGDIPSMYWFAVGIDPLLVFLEKRLQGIPITSVPVLGPAMENCPALPPLTQLYKVVAYADDVKPAITMMKEFFLVDEACVLLEKAAGVKLHRDPTTEKVKFLPLGRWQGTLTQEDLPRQVQYITISDHLNFVGVELRATFVKTRQANGDQLVARVKDTIGPWKGGKFMPLTMRPHSANTFALSKVWYRCSSINLRVSDSTSISSAIKSWLYQDLLQKPSELVLHRHCKDGGLGLLCVRVRALALLIRAFLETAAHPTFRHQLYHELLYRYHVLGETALPDPGFSPYYDKEFFAPLRHYHEHSELNIVSLTTSQWYRLLLEDRLLMSPATTTTAAHLLPVRCESIHPATAWDTTWRLVRTHGLSSNTSSFLFKLVHLLLPTQGRIQRLGADRDQTGGCCMLCGEEAEDLLHAFFICPATCSAGLATIGWTQTLLGSNLSLECALRLDLGEEELDDERALAVTYILGTGLNFIWEARARKKKVEPYEVRAELEALVSLLRRSRHTEAGELVNIALTN